MLENTLLWQIVFPACLFIYKHIDAENAIFSDKHIYAKHCLLLNPLMFCYNITIQEKGDNNEKTIHK